MTNYRRAYVPGGSFFFTAVTYQRRKILTERIARICLRNAIQSVRRRIPFRINAIVLLPDHLHTVWTLPRGDHGFSTRWRQIKSLFTRNFSLPTDRSQNGSRARKREREIWQRRFFEHTCRDEKDFSRCIDYVHINPLKHGIVERVADWPWSSFHRYVRLGTYQSDWGRTGVFYGDEWLDYE